jgi:hypothetical protein
MISEESRGSIYQTSLVDLVSPICFSRCKNLRLRASPTIGIYIVSREYLGNCLNQMVVNFGILTTLQSNIALEIQ